MLVPTIDGTKGSARSLRARRWGGSRLASCLLLTAFTRDHGKTRSLGHRSGHNLGHGAGERVSDAYRGSPSGFPSMGYRGAKDGRDRREEFGSG
jgi:hypothetical protein